MTSDPLATAHGPRRVGWPTDGPDLAVATGRRRLRRRRVAAGGTTLGCLAVLGAGIVATDVHETPPAARGPYAGFGLVRTMTRDARACADLHRDRNGSTAADNGYCTTLLAPASLVVGTPATFTFRLCRMSGLGPHTLAFAHDSEVSFNAAATGGRRGHRRWGVGAFTADWHDVVFTGGDCRNWAIEWAGDDDDGRPLPPGGYTMVASTVPLAWQESDKQRGGTGATAIAAVTLRER